MLNKITIYIKQHMHLFDSFDNVYLFGSILSYKEKINDVDILLIYSEYTDKLLNDMDSICFILEKAFLLPVDLTVLSVKELKSTDFLNRIKLFYKIK